MASRGELDPLGVSLAPRGDLCPLGGIFITSLSSGVNILYKLFKNGGANIIFHPQGIKLPLRNNFAHGCQSKYALRGEIKNFKLS
jgi:hypothetical protein